MHILFAAVLGCNSLPHWALRLQGRCDVHLLPKRMDGALREWTCANRSSALPRPTFWNEMQLLLGSQYKKNSASASLQLSAKEIPPPLPLINAHWL
ncbi:hypothetical protein B0H11DRAFT_46288 [Mycena galericulata]|nr:hypothetical protein B0H11DRAFT_46288 [Mycena galericulata]